MRLLEAFQRFFTGYAVAATLVFCASGVSAQELTVSGVRLAPVVLSDVIMGGVEKPVAMHADVAQATYVVVQFAGVPALMRDRQGVYQPWDLDPAHLADNGFTQSGNQLTFKVFNQDLSDKNFPMRVTLYYRANGELKFGYFDIMRAN